MLAPKPLIGLALPLALTLALGLAACGNTTEAKPGPDPSNPASATSDRGFVVAEIKPAPDALFASIQTEVKKAKSQGLKPYVEFWATWCGPCMAIKHSLDDPQMKAAFKGAYVIQINADDWVEHLEGTGFTANAIPVFFEVGDDGKPTGRKIDGGAWGDNIPANMAPPLDKFFHAKS